MNFWSNGCFGENKSTIDNITVLEKAVLITSKLNKCLKMVELSSEDDLDAHTGLYYFLKGWYFYRTTMDMGDIPYSEALKHRRTSLSPI